jgi:hypothetical protein
VAVGLLRNRVFDQNASMKWKCVHLECAGSGSSFVAIQVSSRMVTFLEWYEVDAENIGRVGADPELTYIFARRNKRSELNHPFLLPLAVACGSPDYRVGAVVAVLEKGGLMSSTRSGNRHIQQSW